MKRIILLAFILNSSFFLFAQSYRPFPTHSGTWSYRYYDDWHNPTTDGSGYSMSGDTVISGLNYKKMFTDIYYSGGIRESGKIIYFYPDTASQEYVLYDFNLNIGDTIIHPFGGAVCSNDTITIDYVDSVLTPDGYHRQLHLSSFATWIEGIGSMSYLLQPAQVACVSGNDILEYMEGDSTIEYNDPHPPPPPPPNCFAYYQTTYDSLLNTFFLTVPSYPVQFSIASYLWDFGDGSTSTLASPSHYYPIDSIYNVCLNVINNSGYSCSYCHLIGIDSSGNIVRNNGFYLNANYTGINETPLTGFSSTLSPNPTTGKTRIQLNQSIVKGNLKIFNIAGQTVLTQEDLNGNEFNFDLSNKDKGIYMIEINSSAGVSRTKIIKY
jgi:hypothetical protein